MPGNTRRLFHLDIRFFSGAHPQTQNFQSRSEQQVLILNLSLSCYKHTYTIIRKTKQRINENHKTENKIFFKINTSIYRIEDQKVILNSQAKTCFHNYFYINDMNKIFVQLF